MEKLNGGILMIGSLLWDKIELRENWRNNYLKINRKIEVNAPIRYGRLSEKRDSIYTMILSFECIDKDKIGKAKFVPFINNPIDFSELKIQSTELIKAEHKKEKLSFNRYNWSWGTLAILFNPEIFKKNHKKNHTSIHFFEEWKKNIGQRFNLNDYKVNDESPIVNNHAILNFDWPIELEEFDFLIVTSNKSNLHKYPTPEEIVEKMVNNKEYFFKNIKHDIKTFQCKAILNLLKNEWN